MTVNTFKLMFFKDATKIDTKDSGLKIGIAFACFGILILIIIGVTVGLIITKKRNAGPRGSILNSKREIELEEPKAVPVEKKQTET